MTPADLERELADLPPLPAVLLQALEVFDDPEFEFERLDLVIRKDQSLVSQVLRVANSPFYGLTGKVSSLRDAFVILGSNTLRNLVLGVGIIRVLGNAAGGPLDQQGLWAHAYGVAMLARRLAMDVPGVDEEAAFVAGLLHDVGKAFMNLRFAEELRRVVAYCESHDCRFIEAEAALLELDHAHVGGHLARRWHLSPEIVSAIGLHHSIDRAGGAPLADIVHVADALCRALAFGNPGDDGVTTIEPAALERLGLDADALDVVLDAVWGQLEAGSGFSLAD